VVKKTALSLYGKVRQTGILAIKLRGDDRLRWVKVTTGEDNIFQVSAKGQSIFYREADIRPMGRTATGVRGIHLREEDYAVSCDVIAAGEEQKADALIVMERGFGKRTPLSMFKMQLRGGMGIRAAQVKPRTGPIVGMRIVYGEDYDVILASSKGQMIRMALKTIKKLQRDTQGVTLIRLNKGDKVTSVTVVRKDKTDKLADIPEEPASLASRRSGPAGKPRGSASLAESRREEPKAAAKKPAKKIAPQSPAPKEATKGKGLPAWAKVHTDTWREPDIFKPRKDIKIHDYKESEAKPRPKSVGEKPFDKTQGKPPKSEEPEEPNYWGGRL
jgi:hypothetical protein